MLSTTPTQLSLVTALAWKLRTCHSHVCPRLLLSSGQSWCDPAGCLQADRHPEVKTNNSLALELTSTAKGQSPLQNETKREIKRNFDSQSAVGSSNHQSLRLRQQSAQKSAGNLRKTPLKPPTRNTSYVHEEHDCSCYTVYRDNKFIDIYPSCIWCF